MDYLNGVEYPYCSDCEKFKNLSFIQFDESEVLPYWSSGDGQQVTLCPECKSPGHSQVSAY